MYLLFQQTFQILADQTRLRQWFQAVLAGLVAAPATKGFIGLVFILVMLQGGPVMAIQVHPDVLKAAEWVSQEINVPRDVILGQWAFEQPSGVKNPEKFNFNIAGLTKKGKPGEWRAYGDIMEFARDYVYSFVLVNWPNAVNSKTPEQYAAALGSGIGGRKYYGDATPAAYASGIKTRIGQLEIPKTESLKIEPAGDSWLDLLQQGLSAANIGIKLNPGIVDPTVEKTVQTGSEAANFVSDPGGYIKQAVSDAVNTAFDPIKSAWNNVGEKISLFTDAFKSAFDGVENVVLRGLFVITGAAVLILGFWIMKEDERSEPVEQT